MTLEWKPIEVLSQIKNTPATDLLAESTNTWTSCRDRLEDSNFDRSLIDIWIKERNRGFAIGTGEVEGLSTLKRGIAEQLITEGLDGVESSHTMEYVDRGTMKGLLRDQEETLEYVFELVKSDILLSHHTVRSLHAKITKHQESATGIDTLGRHTEIPLSKGQYKTRPNNPRRLDREIHPYCPPEQTHSEMTLLLDMHREHQKRNIGMLSEAAWLHHRFVQIHPFQDGNGRPARLLMAYVFVKHNGFPPIIQRDNRARYIDSLEAADDGNLQPLVDFLAVQSAATIDSAVVIARNIIRGRNHFVHANTGITIEGVYHLPGSAKANCWDTPEIHWPEQNKDEGRDGNER